ncbi:hypothetical protein FB451DRAFT_1172364 [Mycena latifolia]|nr:hypothetical protein FB451DRAFT_1172364 [Mycena latifolia]
MSRNRPHTEYDPPPPPYGYPTAALDAATASGPLGVANATTTWEASTICHRITANSSNPGTSAPSPSVVVPTPFIPVSTPFVPVTSRPVGRPSRQKEPAPTASAPSTIFEIFVYVDLPPKVTCTVCRKVKSTKQEPIKFGPMDLAIDISWDVFLSQVADLVETRVKNLAVASFEWHFLNPSSSPHLLLNTVHAFQSMLKPLVSKSVKKDIGYVIPWATTADKTLGIPPGVDEDVVSDDDFGPMQKRARLDDDLEAIVEELRVKYPPGLCKLLLFVKVPMGSNMFNADHALKKTKAKELDTVLPAAEPAAPAAPPGPVPPFPIQGGHPYRNRFGYPYMPFNPLMRTSTPLAWDPEFATAGLRPEFPMFDSISLFGFRTCS